MCGRYTLFRLNDILEMFPWIGRLPSGLLPRYNIAPTQGVPGVANDQPDQLQIFTWGLVPSWAKDPSIGQKMINARAETLPDKPSFRSALKRRRCLIPADGFYEWQARPGQKIKAPMLIRMKDQKPFAFAGLWDHWQDPNGTEILSCTVITTTPNALLSPIHNRMPAILPRELYRPWLDRMMDDEVELQNMLSPFNADAMEAVEVSTRVNSPKNDDPECVVPVEKETLF